MYFGVPIMSVQIWIPFNCHGYSSTTNKAKF